jgi:hypothetical protein
LPCVDAEIFANIFQRRHVLSHGLFRSRD